MGLVDRLGLRGVKSGLGGTGGLGRSFSELIAEVDIVGPRCSKLDLLGGNWPESMEVGLANSVLSDIVLSFPEAPLSPVNCSMML